MFSKSSIATAKAAFPYGVVYGTGYNATTQYFNKNSSATYVQGSCIDFFTIVLGLDAVNSTGPTGRVSYQDVDSGAVLAESRLVPQGSSFTSGPSYSIANTTKLKTWMLPQTYPKVQPVEPCFLFHPIQSFSVRAHILLPHRWLQSFIPIRMMPQHLLQTALTSPLLGSLLLSYPPLPKSQSPWASRPLRRAKLRHYSATWRTL